MEDGFVNDDPKIISGTSTKPAQTDTINSKGRWESRGGSGLVSGLQLGHVLRSVLDMQTCLFIRLLF